MTDVAMPHWLAWWRGEENEIYVNVEDCLRKRAIREREYQAALDADSSVLRTSAACRRAEHRRVSAIVEMERRGH